MKQHQKVVVALGAAGLLPFMLTPFLMIFGHSAIGVEIGQVYGLAIICFLAGSWWGIVLVAGRLTSWDRVTALIVSNMVVIGAVSSVLLFSPGTNLVALAGLLLLQLLIEQGVKGLDRQPLYYLRMRVTLSTVAAICLLLLAWFS